MQAAGTAISVLGALKAGDSAQIAAKFNEEVNLQNAAIARSNAADQARIIDRQNYLRLGAARAAQGHAGGVADTGSAWDVIADAAAQGELEKQYVLYQGELKARGFTNTAELDAYGGEVAKTGSYWKAGSELLSGAVKTYDILKRVG